VFERYFGLPVCGTMADVQRHPLFGRDGANSGRGAGSPNRRE
jgi:hypothetical protein